MKLAFDVGAHNGTDTVHYLDLGYKVVAIEASPDLAGKLRERFAVEIAEGRCVVRNIGVGEVAGVLPFYLSNDPEWNSFNREMAARAGDVGQVDIEIRPLGEIIAEYGEPDFVKIDVEGADFACLRSLKYLPKYLSFEVDKADGEDMISLMIARGYKHFALINQYTHSPVIIPPAGTLAHVKWSGRQWARLKLREFHGLHSLLRRTKSTASGHVYSQSSGPTPMEVTSGWHTPAEFLWLWQNAVDSGTVDSAWFDVHARR